MKGGREKLVKDMIQLAADTHKNLAEELKKVVNEVIDELVVKVDEALNKWMPYICMVLEPVAETLQETLRTVIPDIKVWVDYQYWALEIYSEERDMMRLEEREKKYKYDLVEYIWEFLKENVDLKELRVGVLHSTYVNEDELQKIKELLDGYIKLKGFISLSSTWREKKNEAFRSIPCEFFLNDLYEEKIERR
jgi:hypothetical protein